MNNVLAFPGIFRGALDARSKVLNQKIYAAAAKAIADCVEERSEETIIPTPFDTRVAPKVAKIVSNACRETQKGTHF